MRSALLRSPPYRTAPPVLFAPTCAKVSRAKARRRWLAREKQSQIVSKADLYRNQDWRQIIPGIGSAPYRIGRYATHGKLPDVIWKFALKDMIGAYSPQRPKPPEANSGTRPEGLVKCTRSPESPPHLDNEHSGRASTIARTSAPNPIFCFQQCANVRRPRSPVRELLKRKRRSRLHCPALLS